MMKTRTYTVYKFDELTPEQQQLALDNYRSINVDYDDWHESLLDDWKQRLEDLGFINPKIMYSGFWSQGDGASFTASDIDLAKWLKAKKLGNKYRLILAHASNLGGSVNRTTHHYYHENTVDVELDYGGMGYTIDEMTPDKQAKFYEQIESLQRLTDQEVVKLCGEIYQDLEQEYQYQTNDEAVKETLIANDYDFTTGGRMV